MTLCIFKWPANGVMHIQMARQNTSYIYPYGPSMTFYISKCPTISIYISKWPTNDHWRFHNQMAGQWRFTYPNSPTMTFYISEIARQWHYTYPSGLSLTVYVSKWPVAITNNTLLCRCSVPTQARYTCAGFWSLRGQAKVCNNPHGDGTRVPSRQRGLYKELIIAGAHSAPDDLKINRKNFRNWN